MNPWFVHVYETVQVLIWITDEQLLRICPTIALLINWEQTIPSMLQCLIVQHNTIDISNPDFLTSVMLVRPQQNSLHIHTYIISIGYVNVISGIKLKGGKFKELGTFWHTFAGFNLFLIFNMKLIEKLESGTLGSNPNEFVSFSVISFRHTGYVTHFPWVTNFSHKLQLQTLKMNFHSLEFHKVYSSMKWSFEFLIVQSCKTNAPYPGNMRTRESTSKFPVDSKHSFLI